MDAVVKREIPSPSRESNPRSPIVQPVAQRYITRFSINALHQILSKSSDMNMRMGRWTWLPIYAFTSRSSYKEPRKPRKLCAPVLTLHPSRYAETKFPRVSKHPNSTCGLQLTVEHVSVLMQHFITVFTRTLWEVSTAVGLEINTNQAGQSNNKTVAK
jgi:hypothetical protein